FVFFFEGWGLGRGLSFALHADRRRRVLFLFGHFIFFGADALDGLILCFGFPEHSGLGGFVTVLGHDRRLRRGWSRPGLGRARDLDPLELVADLGLLAGAALDGQPAILRGLIAFDRAKGVLLGSLAFSADARVAIVDRFAAPDVAVRRLTQL